MAESTPEAKGCVSFDVVLEEAKSPKVEKPDMMTTSVTTLEDLENKQKAAEDRRKKRESLKLEKLSAQEKHAEEVRAKRKNSNNENNGEAANGES